MDEKISQRVILIVACIASFITPFMTSSINLAIIDISSQFQSSSLISSWIVTSFILAAAAFLLPLGRLSDLVGQKKIFNLGLLIFTIATLLCALSWSIVSLLVFRSIQGIGCSMMFGTSNAMLTLAYPPQERGKVLGISVSCVYLGLSLGPILGGILNYNLGWRSIFWLMVPVCLIALIISLVFLKQEQVEAKKEKFDFTGSWLYFIGITALLFGIISIFEISFAKYLVAFGLILFVIFLTYEYRQNSPVFNVKLFSHNLVFTFSNLAAFINYCATFAVTYIIAIYLQKVLGLNSQVAGVIMLAQPVLMAVLSPVTGRLSDRIEPRLLASAGMTLSTIGLFLFSFLQADTEIWKVVINLGFIGLGFALFSSPNTNSVMGSVERQYTGVASSTLATMRLCGQSFSMAIVTMLLALYLGGGTELEKAEVSSLVTATQVSFRVFTVLCLIGIVASYARGKMRKA